MKAYYYPEEMKIVVEVAGKKGRPTTFKWFQYGEQRSYASKGCEDRFRTRLQMAIKEKRAIELLDADEVQAKVDDAIEGHESEPPERDEL